MEISPKIVVIVSAIIITLTSALVQLELTLFTLVGECMATT